MTATDRSSHEDLLTTLHGADPATAWNLSTLDDASMESMRQGILLTPREPIHSPSPTPAKHKRRLALAGALTVGLVAVGTGAYAAYDRWYVGGSYRGLTCMSTYVDPATNDLRETTGGPPITSDPIADCQQYQQLSGREPIRNPVAITRDDMTIVAPADEIPSAAVAAQRPTDREEAMTRLQQSLDDYVDGGLSRCFTLETGPAWARAEADRLGLTDVPVEEQKLGSDTRRDGPCGWFLIPNGKGPILFSPERQQDHNVADSPDSVSYRLRDGLRVQVATKCVSLPEAVKITAGLMGANHHWPTSAINDESLKCTSVDLVTGGSMQVFLRGPSKAGN